MHINQRKPPVNRRMSLLRFPESSKFSDITVRSNKFPTARHPFLDYSNATSETHERSTRRVTRSTAIAAVTYRRVLGSDHDLQQFSISATRTFAPIRAGRRCSRLRIFLDQKKKNRSVGRTWGGLACLGGGEKEKRENSSERSRI